MTNNKIIQVFEENSSRYIFKCLVNLYDVFMYPNIKGSVKMSVRNNFDIVFEDSYQEEILWVRDTSFWNARNQGLVITDQRIIWIGDNNNVDETKLDIPWESINKVTREDDIIYLWLYNGNSIPFYTNELAKQPDDEIGTAKIFERLFADCLSTIESVSDKEHNSHAETLYKEVLELENKKDWDSIIAMFLIPKNKELLNYIPKMNEPLIHAFVENGEHKNGIYHLDDYFNGSNDEFIEYWSYLYGIVYEDLQQHNLAREYTFRSLSFFNKLGGGEVSQEDFNRIDEKFTNSFTSLPYRNRRLLMPVDSYSNLDQKVVSVIDIQKIPETIKFPLGYPTAYQLYIAHPYISNYYMEFEKYELLIIEDQVRELCHIMQSLGATDITIECMNATTEIEEKDVSGSLSASACTKVISASSEASIDRNDNFVQTLSRSLNMRQQFQPTSIGLPENLVWFEHTPSWKRIYQQRMQGGLLSHEEKIDTRKSQLVQFSELAQIEGEIKTLINSANLALSKDTKNSLSAHDHAIISIKVKFAPLENTLFATSKTADNAETVEKSLENAEQLFLEDIAFIYENGEVGDLERRFLTRRSEKLGISSSRATELERMFLEPMLTDEEKEYLETCKEIIGTGVISEKVRRLLNRERELLGLSEIRATEIEKML